jgi:hypothetical protein
MVGEAFAGLSAIKTAFDIAKGLKDIDDAARRNAAVIELQKKILAAREAQSTLLDRVGELEKEVARFETWDAEKERYELKAFGRGVAYALKPEAQGTDPPHHICATCYDRRKKSFLQPVPDNSARRALGMGTVYRCSECRTEISV